MKTFQKITLKRTCASLLCAAIACAPWIAGATPEHQSYTVTNLIADTPGIAANTDTNLINAWGTVDPSGNLFITENGSQQVEFFLADGTPLDFSINATGGPSGIIFNSGTNDFKIGTGSNAVSAALLIATESGTILGFNLANNPNTAVVVVDRSASNSVYKGVATARAFGREILYATDFHNGRIDGFDSQFNYLGSFTDPRVPAGFAPFNIRNIEGLLYVTFAKQLLPDKHDDQAGPGNGFVDIFAPEGFVVRRLIEQGHLNSPWGLALAPGNFGRFSYSLLVGNFGDGVINAYDPFTGRFLGSLNDSSNKPIVLQGLWALDFAPAAGDSDGDGDFDRDDPLAVLYFSSGPGSENHGLVGAIMSVTKPAKRHNLGIPGQ